MIDGLWAALWWVAWLVLAILYQPLVARLFPGFVDRGWACARTVGLGISAYLCWLAASAGVAPFTRTTALVALLVPGLLVHVGLDGPAALRSLWRTQRAAVLRVELASGLVFLFFVALRALRPEVSGLEKFMDYGLAAAVFRATSMPPIDMWYAGEPVNYYYYGHYLLALVAKATGIPLAIAYNLMIAQVAALSAGLGVTVAGELARLLGAHGRRAAAAGLLGAALLVLSGNLHGFAYGVALPTAEAVGLRESEFRSRAHEQAGYYWYSDATRYIGYNPCTNDKVIHEFPFYSFLVADLHGHVSALPWVLTLLAFVLAPLAGGKLRAPPRLRNDVVFALCVGFLLGTLRMTNTWDVPIYGVVFAAVLGARALAAPGRAASFASAAGLLAIAGGTAALVSFPFARHIEQHYTEIFFVQHRSALAQLAVLWGVPVAVVLGTALVELAAAARSRTWAAPRSVWLALAGCALGLLVVPEVIAVRDIYPDTYERGNTYFKLTFQAFALLSLLVASAVAVQARTRVRVAAAVLLVAPLFAYAPLGVRGHHGLPDQWQLRGLDGLAFLAERRPGERAAVDWLLENAPPGAAILEADGNSYTDAGRISMATGLPTVLGWYVHEWLWRGGTRPVDERRAQVRVAYELPRLAAVHQLFERYGVRYLVIGPLERERFPALDEAGLRSHGTVVFDEGSIQIIEVAPGASAP